MGAGPPCGPCRCRRGWPGPEHPVRSAATATPPASATDPPAVRNPRRFTSQFPPKPVAPRHSLPAAIRPTRADIEEGLDLARDAFLATDDRAWPGPAALRHLTDGLAGKSLRWGVRGSNPEPTD